MTYKGFLLKKTKIKVVYVDVEQGVSYQSFMHPLVPKKGYDFLEEIKEIASAADSPQAACGLEVAGVDDLAGWCVQ